MKVRNGVGIGAAVAVSAVLLGGVVLGGGSSNSSVSDSIAVIAAQQNAAPAPAQFQDASCISTGMPVSMNPGTITGPPSRYDSLYVRAATTFAGSLDATTLKAQAIQESGENPRARNAGSGASGMIQFMPATWAVHGIDGDGDGRADILNVADNIMSSAKYSSELRKIVSDLSGDQINLTLAAYNAGPGNVKKYGGIPPFRETQNYVTQIRARVVSWGAASAVSAISCAAVVPVRVTSGEWAKPIAVCTKTSPYGNRGAVAGVHGARFHAGQDCGARIGTPLFAIHAGTLTQKNDPGGYGTYYSLKSTDGTEVIYGHMSKLELPTGTVVAAGQRIGLSGNTGGSSGPHLHFEVRVSGKPTEPNAFMRERGVTL